MTTYLERVEQIKTGLLIGCISVFVMMILLYIYKWLTNDSEDK